VREQPAQQTPPVQRLRIRYAKRGRLRFTSHRDFSRAFERAIRRAGLPMAYSSGFSPHPRISYANASPTGASSEAEYLEIALVEVCDIADVQARLDAALPPGLDVVDVVVAGPGALAERLQAGAWLVELPGVDPDELAEAVEAFLARDTVEVERMTKRGMRSFDSRGAVVRLSTRVAPASGTVDLAECAILELVVRHGTPAVRPDDILAGLRQVSGLVASVPPRQTRLAQGPLDLETGNVGDPLDPDRDATAPPDATADGEG
jgi:radical SAM-linked protein